MAEMYIWMYFDISRDISREVCRGLAWNLYDKGFWCVAFYITLVFVKETLNLHGLSL